MSALDPAARRLVSADRLPHGVSLALLFAAAVASFFPLIVGETGFLAWDDTANIVYQPAVQGWSSENLAAAWSGSTLSQGLYEPISVMLQMLTIELFGLEVRPFHVTTLVIHILNCWLLFWLALLLIRKCEEPLLAQLRPEWAAFVAALLFAVHPMRVEVVAWATGQSYALAGLFLLLSLIAYVRYTEARLDPPKGKPALLLGLSVVCYACATLSKGAAIFLPPALLLLDFYPLRRVGPRREFEAGVLLDKLPHALVGTALFAIIWTLTSDKQGAGYFELDFTARVAYALHALVFHLGKMLWPASVHPAYGVNRPDVHPFAGPLLFSTLFVLVGTGFAWHVRRRAPWLSSALGIYALGMLPVCGFFMHGDWLRGADRYTYMPLVGLWIVLGAGVTAKPVMPRISAMPATGLGDSRSRLVLAGLLGVLISWGITTYRVTGHWSSDEALWLYTLEVDPANRVALQNLGTVYNAQGQFEEALPLFAGAIRLDPGHNVAAPLNLGFALDRLDRAQEAISVYQRALVHNPNSAKLHNNLAAAYWKLGDRETARIHMRRTEELQAEAARGR